MAQIHHQAGHDQAEAQAHSPGSKASQQAAVKPSFLNWVTRPLAGLAVAAGVAVVTVALWQPLEQESGSSDDNLVNVDEQKIQRLAGQQIQGGAVPVSTRVQTLGMRWKVEHESPGMQQKLNAYLVNHTEQSNSMQGLIPQARVAGFDTQ